MKIGYGVILLLLFILVPLAHTLYMQEGYELLAENGYTKLGNNMNAKECQEECLKKKNCKYVNRPRRHNGKVLKEGKKGPCFMSTDFGQKAVGKKNDKFKTWRNKLYIAPKQKKYVRTLGHCYPFYRYWWWGRWWLWHRWCPYKNKKSAEKACKRQGLELCDKHTYKKWRGGRHNICRSGWTTDGGKGFWVGRWGGWWCGGHWRKYYNGWNYRGKSGAHCCRTFQDDS